MRLRKLSSNFYGRGFTKTWSVKRSASVLCVSCFMLNLTASKTFSPVKMCTILRKRFETIL